MKSIFYWRCKLIRFLSGVRRSFLLLIDWSSRCFISPFLWGSNNISVLQREIPQYNNILVLLRWSSKTAAWTNWEIAIWKITEILGVFFFGLLTQQGVFKHNIYYFHKKKNKITTTDQVVDLADVRQFNPPATVKKCKVTSDQLMFTISFQIQIHNYRPSHCSYIAPHQQRRINMSDYYSLSSTITVTPI